MKNTMRFGILGLAAVGLAGCTQPRPVTMAPPIAPPAPPAAVAPENSQVYNWKEVPAGQQVPIRRAVFDQGGYQLYAASGETIVVPFENQNMYVMKFGRTTGDMYFVNDSNTAPTLYVREGAGLENAAAQGALWYPFPQNYAYTRPVYLGIAPSWSAYSSMGWYPGMHYYGGYYSYNPWHAGLAYAAMPGLMINIGGRPYYGWSSYNSYYRSNPVNRVMVTSRNSFNYSSAGRRGTSSGSSFGRPSGSTGSFGRTSGTRTSTGGGFSASRPSFGSGSSASRPSGSFGRSSSPSSGGFSAAKPAFGSGSSSASRPSGSFGGSSSGFGSSSGRTGSFGSGSSGFSSSRPSSGSSFGRSSGSSFGGGRSFGGGGRRR